MPVRFRPSAPLEPQVFRKIKLEVLILKNFVVLQKVLQNSQHFIFMKSLFSGLNKDFLFSNTSNNFLIYNSISSFSLLFELGSVKFKLLPITNAEFCFDSIST